MSLTSKKKRVIWDTEYIFFMSCLSDLTEWHVKSSALALVDGQPWHMHRPLTHSCDLTLLTFKDNDPQIANQVSVCLRCLT